MMTARNLGTAFVLTLAGAAATMLLLFALGPDWSVYAPASCKATRCFCEAPRLGALVLQPANSWSSYGYAFAGMLMIVLARRPDGNSAFGCGAATLFGATAVFVGLGSALLHATLNLWGQFFDVAGMYLTSGFMLIYGLARWRVWNRRNAIPAYLGLLAVLLVVLYTMPEMRRWLFAVILIAAIAVELVLARPRRPGVQIKHYVTGMGLTALAFAIWNLDQHGLACRPESLIQGHAIWHLLGAVATWLTFLYYRSEHAAEQSG
jgi:hypothetical protein